jgi:glutaredoxin
MTVLYMVYTTDKCPQCDSLKQMVDMKEWNAYIKYKMATSEDMDLLRSNAQRSFPCIYDITEEQFVDIQTFFAKMALK